MRDTSAAPPRTSAAKALALVVPVWGGRHTRRFLDLALPSWLGPGGVPALAARRRFTLHVVTTAEDAVTLEQHPLFADLRTAARVEIVPMDDLVGSAGPFVTLTLAYQRGLARAAEAAGVVDAILLNADFLLARGSLARVLDVLDSGARVVLAATLRAVEEEVAPRLLRARSPDGTLSLPARDLVSLAFSALHPTVICARADQGAVQSLGAHQMFWRPEPATLVGRGFCLFPLAIEVRAPVGPAETFCDYGLGPLLAPGASPVVINDSDDFFALELAPLEQELRFLGLGAASPGAMASRIGGWSVAYHREQARTALFYRSDDPGPAVEPAVDASARYVAEVLDGAPPPQPLRHHPHWLAAVALWRTDREERGLAEDPPELAGTPDVRATPTPSAVRRLARTLLVGRPGRRSLLHPRRSLDRAIRRRLHEIGGEAEVLFLNRGLVSEFLAAAADPAPSLPKPEDAPLWLSLDPRRPEAMAVLLGQARPALARARSATVLALCDREGQVTPRDLAQLLSWLDGEMDLQRVETFDLRLDERVRHVHGRMADRFSGAGWRGRWRLAAGAAGALAWMTAANLARLIAVRQRPRHLSAVLIAAAPRR